MRDVAATSLLSHRWSDLWKHTSRLRFTSCIDNAKIEHTSWEAETCKNVKMVNSVLKSHQATFVKRFKICFYVNKSAQSTFTKWLEFVWSRQVKKLDLDLCCWSKEHAVVLGDSVGGMRPMKYLETLSLSSLTISGEDISLFLKNCPVLRKLRITKSSLTSDVHVVGTTLMLEEFQISLCDINESVINISAPNLSIVIVDARPEQLWFENVPRLIVASLGIENLSYIMHHFPSAVSCFTSQLKILILYLSYPNKVMFYFF